MAGGLSLQTRRELLEHMAPQYREVAPAKKGVLLDVFTQTTGYHRTYAQWLLNHSEEVLQTVVRHPRPHHYGPEVQDALVQAWNAANRICAKRLIPYLPTLLDALEWHGHLHLTQACRAQLLSMSAATADRLLCASRRQGLHGLSTTQAGPLLKQQIPIRTFQQWNETQPSFLEVDLVAHCGADRGRGFAGGFVWTLTLTDVATGWTECLALFYQSRETVLAAIQHARCLFPFPILGNDTDNGGEFINEVLMAYCEQEHLTFTRGRPQVKNDHCFVEQKNRTIVRQVVGYDRFMGEQACRQLRELYRALRLYVNCFQPSMKLLSKQRDGRKISYHYDPAKTPLQRLLLSGILPEQKRHELHDVAQALDPIGLFEQLKQLQKAPFRCAVDGNPFVSLQLPCRFASLQWNSAQRDWLLSKGASPICQEGSQPCTRSRRSENESWAGDGRRKIPSRESGSGSPPGYGPTLSAVVGTSSGSYSVSPLDVISRCRSARGISKPRLEVPHRCPSGKAEVLCVFCLSCAPSSSGGEPEPLERFRRCFLRSSDRGRPASW